MKFIEKLERLVKARIAELEKKEQSKFEIRHTLQLNQKWLKEIQKFYERNQKQGY